MIKILVLGDIVGRPGRRLVMEKVSEWALEGRYDFVIANCENAAGGAGITGKLARGLLKAGIDGLTLGDHCWDRRVFLNEVDELEGICRPANLPAAAPGKDRLILEKNQIRLGVFTVMGRNFITPHTRCPFLTADRLIEELTTEVDFILVEAHAEATSEKVALGWYLDGRCSAVFGTHTHVATADAQILPKGTAYITDLGMSGPHAGVLGRETQPVLDRFIDGIPRRFPVAKGDVKLCGIELEMVAPGQGASSIRSFVWPGKAPEALSRSGHSTPSRSGHSTLSRSGHSTPSRSGHSTPISNQESGK